MADTKISALTSLAGSGVDTTADVLPVVDTNVTTTKKILVSNLLGALFTAAGDIFQASAAGVGARLGIGTARQVPMVNAGATALAYTNPITLGTEQASTSGTSIDFTSIPAGVRRITVMFSGVSTNGISPIIIQLGDAGGFETTGYVSTASSNGSGTGSTAGFIIMNVAVAARTYYGAFTLSLQDASDFTWVGSGNMAADSTTIEFAAGGKSLSAELTQVRITMVNGTDAFDAGVINISYE